MLIVTMIMGVMLIEMIMLHDHDTMIHGCIHLIMIIISITQISMIITTALSVFDRTLPDERSLLTMIMFCRLIMNDHFQVGDSREPGGETEQQPRAPAEAGEDEGLPRGGKV